MTKQEVWLKALKLALKDHTLRDLPGGCFAIADKVASEWAERFGVTVTVSTAVGAFDLDVTHLTDAQRATVLAALSPQEQPSEQPSPLDEAPDFDDDLPIDHGFG